MRAAKVIEYNDNRLKVEVIVTVYLFHTDKHVSIEYDADSCKNEPLY